MRYNTESNERKSRQSAISLAIALHLGLGALLYLSMGDQPKQKTDNQPIVNTATKQPNPAARPRTVHLP
ncbi:MAG: hypothetical protein ACOYPR_15940 [Saprospiraceae bacterium]